MTADPQKNAQPTRSKRWEQIVDSMQYYGVFLTHLRIELSELQQACRHTGEVLESGATAAGPWWTCGDCGKSMEPGF